MNQYHETKEITEYYAKYRPSYNDEIADVIMKYFKDHQTTEKASQDQFDLMVDVGCGSGQATTAFAPYFRNILAIDISSNQIELGTQNNQHHKNISFKVAAAESIPVEDKSVDLIVSGTAAHWFDLELFFKEVRRVLKPNGCMALFSYTHPIIIPYHTCNTSLGEKGTALLHDEMCFRENSWIKTESQKRIADYCSSGYKSVLKETPFAIKEIHDPVNLNLNWSMNDMIGYLKSYTDYYADGVANFDSIKIFSANLKKIWNIEDVNNDDVIAKTSFVVNILLSIP